MAGRRAGRGMLSRGSQSDKIDRQSLAANKSLRLLLVSLQMGFEEPQPLIEGTRHTRVEIGSASITQLCGFVDCRPCRFGQHGERTAKRLDVLVPGVDRGWIFRQLRLFRDAVAGSVGR